MSGNIGAVSREIFHPTDPYFLGQSGSVSYRSVRKRKEPFTFLFMLEPFLYFRTEWYVRGVNFVAALLGNVLSRVIGLQCGHSQKRREV